MKTAYHQLRFVTEFFGIEAKFSHLFFYSEGVLFIELDEKVSNEDPLAIDKVPSPTRQCNYMLLAQLVLN